MEDWALIRHLHRSEKLSQRAIAKRLGIARDTVANALVSDTPPKYQRPPVASAISDAEPKIRALLSAYPTMPATVIAERIGWTGSITWLREKVRSIRPEYAPADPADRLDHEPGKAVQCDLWFPPVQIPLGFGLTGSPPVVVMVAAFSRFITAMMLPSRTTMDLVAGMWRLLDVGLGAVPHQLWWDNEAGIGRRGRLTAPVTSFVGTLSTTVIQLKPYDPESKGIVERANRYLETSFLPGRSFTSPADFNDQLAEWLPRANHRSVRRIDGRPDELVAVDTAAMLTLPPVPPQTSTVTPMRLPRDYYVRACGNDYSVDPSAIGHLVDVTTGLDTVVVTRAGRRLAEHERVWAHGLTLTDPAHVETAARLRTNFQQQHEPDDGQHPVRDLADYDRVFGVEFDIAATTPDNIVCNEVVA
ncbi:IS21 family transposase [Rhodococcus pyridinivorans]|uniref:IS21 family transposase n=1 Tax=Rhodococcus pyridinivorans TaxID=103816 RepID=A0A7M2XUC9_9NOCA|nr:IS21 family transposase [Rhodococcus pyridinivorans]QOW01386.1 IS21 family transposase [Rhodococcus pyridinivorans]WMM75203.1 IS21 family transposase [Rhodococcus pyridinivorans]